MNDIKRAFLLLPGPHLNEVDLSLRKHAIVICLSRAAFIIAKLDESNDIYFGCADGKTIIAVTAVLDKFDEDKIFLFEQDKINHSYDRGIKVPMGEQLLFTEQITKGMIREDTCPWGSGVINDAGFPLCLHLGINVIYIVGMNHDMGPQFCNKKLYTRRGKKGKRVLNSIEKAMEVYKRYFDKNEIKD